MSEMTQQYPYAGHDDGKECVNDGYGNFSYRQLSPAELAAREPALQIARDIYKHAGQAGVCYYPIFLLIAKTIETALSAPPAGDAGYVRGLPNVDWLANVIRTANGNHLNPIGAGALAEKIVEALQSSEPQKGNSTSIVASTEAPSGYVVVPVEPTTDMLTAGMLAWVRVEQAKDHSAYARHKALWTAMLAIAPGQQEAALDFQQESPEAEAWRLEREGRLPAPAEKPSDDAESTKTP